MKNLPETSKFNNVNYLVDGDTNKKMSSPQLELRLQSIFDNMLEGCQIIGFDFKYLYVNTTVCLQGHKTKKELLGKTMMSVYPGIDKTPLFAHIRECMQKRKPQKFENQFTYSDGKSGWFELSMEPVEEGVLIFSFDVTDKLVLEEINKSKYRKMLENLEDVVHIMDAKGTVSYVTNSVTKVLGYSPEVFLHTNVLSYVHPDDKKLVQSKIKFLIDHPNVHIDPIEVRIRDKNDEYRIIEIIGTNFMSDPSIGGIVVTSRDVTNRRENEQILAERTKIITEEKVRDDAILASIGEGLIATDTHGTVTIFNNAAQKMLGYSEKEFIHKNITDVLNLTDRSNKHIPTKDRPIMSVLATGKNLNNSTTYTYISKKGRAFPIAVTAAPVRVKGRIIGAIQVFRDMTDEIRHDLDLQKFKMAVEFASDQIIISDNEGVIIYANKATEKMTGFSQEEAIGSKSGTLWGKQMNDEYYQNLWHIIKEEKKEYIGEVTNKHKDGHLYISELHISPMLDEKNNVLFYVSLERDISRIKEIDKAKTEFVSIASHELRTPLGVTKWYLEAMKSEGYLRDAPKIAEEYFNTIYQSTERLLLLVRDLLSVSRIDQGKVKDSPVEVDISKVLKEILHEMRLIASQARMGLEYSINKDAIPPLFIDVARFQEVIENLVGNAIKYSKPDGIIKVTLDRKGDTVLIKVKDMGLGISKEDQKKLFSKFFRAERAILNKTEGSGLGLYVAKSYVEGWGGNITVESQEGKGATFTVTLPIEKLSQK